MEHFFVSTSSNTKTLAPKVISMYVIFLVERYWKTFFEYRAICEQHKCM